ncbi:hypothetical protein FCK90_08555 [Kocuria coralli]|uniref:Uncharacterized protein n=1 Tax=Kocuria coralli TaxID=1461025 RepID=A0A5J5KXL4_9MICC|nr:hypothetical protein [Kocuria coralli]KAA9394158.1 hypothetical protein FCK90_08555 [Kocuria coralli]
MAVQTEFDVKFSCGHRETRDLSDRPAGKRKGFASWLAKGECLECWKKSKQKEELGSRREAAAADAKKMGLPELDGSEQQLLWAPLFRDSLIKHAHEDLCRGEDPVMSEDEFEDRIMKHARAITRAGWWMDQADAESQDLEELVSTALDDEDAVNGCENPL